MANPNLKNEDPTVLKITTKDVEIKELKNKKRNSAISKIFQNLSKLIIIFTEPNIKL